MILYVNYEQRFKNFSLLEVGELQCNYLHFCLESVMQSAHVDICSHKAVTSRFMLLSLKIISCLNVL